MQIAITPDIRLFVDIEGPGWVPDGPALREKPTLILLHGGPGFDHSSFKPLFSRLADVAQIVYVDHRGHGRSSRCPPEDWTLDTFADDVVRLCDDAALVGCTNLTNVVMGVLRSGYLGYFAFAAKAGQGLMTEGLRAVVRQAFGPPGLHRLEANIQPGNTASIALVRACGFVREGWSPKYQKNGAHWRDHERWTRVRP